MFYYKNIGENEVPECNRGGNFVIRIAAPVASGT